MTLTNVKAKVAVCIPSYATQHPTWWTKIMSNLLSDQLRGIDILAVHTSSSMLYDQNKNLIMGATKRRGEATDNTRNLMADGVLASNADWVYWIDDDTVPPMDALPSMLSRQREFVSGIYILPKPPYAPIAYMRRDDGMYSPIASYPKGAMFEVDSVGMGCALIHRSVYERIMDHHKILQRPDGAYYPVHEDQIRDMKPFQGKSIRPYVKNGELHQPIKFIEEKDMGDRLWPFYILDSQRTEDHFFCELCDNVGVKPWLDTTIECKHIKMKAFEIGDFQDYATAEEAKK